jgi:hydrogenase maturation factor
VGFALNKVDEAEALETLAILRQIEAEEPPS